MTGNILPTQTRVNARLDDLMHALGVCHSAKDTNESLLVKYCDRASPKVDQEYPVALSVLTTGIQHFSTISMLRLLSSKTQGSKDI